jgi:endonuclease/exonuclease/phosphatase family metal-dependent hydrolase
LLPKGNPDEEQRGLLEAVIDVDGQQVRAMTTHLQHDNADSRLLQARAVADAVRAAAEPVVLTGDLNAPPTEPEITTLTALLADSHAAAGHGDGFTHPAQAPTARIDYVLSDGRPIHSEVLPTQASDHRPVLAKIRR